jgi:hypothetical protein
VVRGKLFTCAPLANWIIGASEGVMAIVLAVYALGEVVEMEVVFQAIGGREGRQVGSLCDVLCLGASDKKLRWKRQISLCDIRWR